MRHCPTQRAHTALADDVDECTGPDTRSLPALLPQTRGGTPRLSREVLWRQVGRIRVISQPIHCNRGNACASVGVVRARRSVWASCPFPDSPTANPNARNTYSPLHASSRASRSTTRPAPSRRALEARFPEHAVMKSSCHTPTHPRKRLVLCLICPSYSRKANGTTSPERAPTLKACFLRCSTFEG